MPDGDGRVGRDAFRVVVPCSTSNLGCGFDCLGLALTPELTVEIRTRSGHDGAGSRRFGGTLAEAPLAGEERIERAMRAWAGRAGRDLPTFALTADSTIPIARGLGSSGSATVAGLVAADRLLGTNATVDELFAVGCELEGHPDNIGPALVGGCVVAMPEPSGGKVAWYRARLHPELRAAVAVPLTRLETERARAVLPREVSLDTARDQARKLAQLLRGLEDLDARRLRLGVDDRLHTPHRLTLIRGGRQVLDAAVAAGALAAAISGSGSAVVALGRGDLTAAAEAMRAAFIQAGESATAFVSGVPSSGYRVEALSEARPT